MKRIFFLIFAVVSVLLASSASFAATTTYTRLARWDTTVSDPATGSDSEANVTGSMWKYEQIDATATDGSMDLAGANPWWKMNAISTPMVWVNIANSFAWGGAQGVSGSNYPRGFNTNIRLNGRGSSNYGHDMRIIWVAPAAGTVKLTGTMALAITSATAGLTANLDWAIAKRVGGVVQSPALASGTAATATGVAVTVDMSTLPNVQSVSMAAGDEIFYTFRNEANNIPNSDLTLTDGAYSTGTTVDLTKSINFEFTTGGGVSGVRNWHNY